MAPELLEVELELELLLIPLLELVDPPLELVDPPPELLLDPLPELLDEEESPPELEVLKPMSSSLPQPTSTNEVQLNIDNARRRTFMTYLFPHTSSSFS